MTVTRQGHGTNVYDAPYRGEHLAASPLLALITTRYSRRAGYSPPGRNTENPNRTLCMFMVVLLVLL